MKPRLLDLFCGAGGAAKGYADAGFEVVGVDIKPQPRYPFEFVQADAMTFPLDGFDAIHASPPCQDHSRLRTLTDDHGTAWMLAATRERLVAWAGPWVIENVEGARTAMHSPVLICGGAFGLGAQSHGDIWRPLRRHRLFEANVWLMTPGCGCSGKEKLGVYGTGSTRFTPRRRGYQAVASERAEGLGIDWMTSVEMAQAIPAYTHFIGEQLIAHLSTLERA